MPMPPADSSDFWACVIMRDFCPVACEIGLSEKKPVDNRASPVDSTQKNVETENFQYSYRVPWLISIR